MKRGLFCVLFFIFLLACCCAHAASVELPDYDSHRLSHKELLDFFGTPSDHVPLEATQLLLNTYRSLENSSETVFGMNFTAVEDSNTAQTKDYAHWNADFVLTPNNDISVLLIGRYGDFGTIPIPIIYKIKAGEEFRVMENAFFGTWTYAAIVSIVHSFDCVAIPITSEFQTAFQTELNALLNGTPVDHEQFNEAIDGILNATPAPANTTLTLSLNLYETDNGIETGISHTVGAVNAFTYKPIPQQLYTLPQTGDSSSIAAWTALCAACLSAVLIIRKKHASIR